MSTPDFDSWEFRPAAHPQGLADCEKYYADLRLRFLQEHAGSEATKTFFAPYDARSTEVFLHKYAEAKVQAVRYAHQYIKRIEGVREIQFPDDTRKALDAILQKKLFNLQMQWRAGLIDLRPDVEVSADFHYWSDNIRLCPFIDRVTEEELETMRDYLRQPFFDYRDFSRGHFSQHVEYSEDEARTLEEPDWFHFYNLRHGTGGLAFLPDLRGPVEDRYVQAAQEMRKATTLPAQAVPYLPPPPYLHAGFDQIIAFAQVADDACFEAIFRQEKWDADERQRAEEASGVPDAGDILVYLESIKNPPPVPRAGVSWQQAAADVWNAYMAEAVATDLALEWGTCELYRAAGIHPTEDVNHQMPALRFFPKQQNRRKRRQWLVDLILDGREALGEPRDLDF